MSLIKAIFVGSFLYILCLIYFTDNNQLHLRKIYRCDPKEKVKLNSNLKNIHEPSGKIKSTGFTFDSNLRFDRRILRSNKQFLPTRFFRLKENDLYEFFSKNKLFQIGIQ